MDLGNMVTDLFLSELGSEGGGLDASTVQSALGAVLGGVDGQIDLPALIEKFSGGDFASLAQSWRGEGGATNA
ncbi:MAG: hypothetical protein P8R42_28345 [Candidatus Binatia bacterium]|nr:hypothetical protein [Candidatus Binatia bacterium]